MQRELSLDTMEFLDDGRVKEAWQQALMRVIADVRDRPGAGDARKVSLVAELVPTCDETGELDTVRVAFQVKDSIPVRKSKVYEMQARKGMLIFNDLSPDDPNQHTLDEMADFNEGGDQ